MAGDTYTGTGGAPGSLGARNLETMKRRNAAAGGAPGVTMANDPTGVAAMQAQAQQIRGAAGGGINTSQGLYGGLWKSASPEARTALSEATAANRAQGGEGMSNQERRQFLQNFGKTGGEVGGAPLPGEGGAPGAGGAGTTAAGYAPPGGAGGAGSTGLLRQLGEGLTDPESAYTQRMQEGLTGRMGAETEAQRRLASFDASQSGYGGGESPELMAMLGDIGVGGQEALGEAMGSMALEAPRLGGQFLGAAQQGELGYAGQDLERELQEGRVDLSKWQTGRAEEESQRQRTQQSREAQQQREKESWYMGEQQRMEAERLAFAREQAEKEEEWRRMRMEREMAMSGYGDGGGGGAPVPRGGGALSTNVASYGGGLG